MTIEIDQDRLKLDIAYFKMENEDSLFLIEDYTLLEKWLLYCNTNYYTKYWFELLDEKSNYQDYLYERYPDDTYTRDYYWNLFMRENDFLLQMIVYKKKWMEIRLV